MADLERLHIKLGLSGTYWGKRPQYSVSFNNQLIKSSEIGADSDVVEYIEFDAVCDTDSAELRIEFLNKSHEDTVQDDAQTTILKDMLLNIVSLEVDDIDLGQLPYSHGVYNTNEVVSWDGADTQSITNCVNLGWNGTWRLTWTNPFYIWLLENM